MTLPEIDPTELHAAHHGYQVLGTFFQTCKIVDPHVMLVVGALIMATEARMRNGNVDATLAQIDAILLEVRAMAWLLSQP
jgi:hypothetical protein